jgi:hypothetical protein
MSDFTTTTNFSLKKPTVGQAVDLWGTYINSNFDEIDSQLQTLTVSIQTPDLEGLGNVLNTTPSTNDFLRFNGESWAAATVSIPSSIDDLSDVDTSTTAPTTGQALVWSGSKWSPSTPTAATIADASITTAKLDTGLQTQIGRILVTDDDDTPTNGQILQYSTADTEWKYADLPGSTLVTLSDVNSGSLADNALLVYNSTAGEFQFESGSTLRTTLGVDSAGTDNSTDISISSATSYDYITLSAGQVLTINQVNLGTDVTGTLPLAQGGTGGTTASAARTNLGLGALATQSTITESQISDLGSYITASSTDTLTNKSGNISQWTNDSGYLTAETNNLSTVSGTLGTANGGTGLTVIGTANQVLAVNTGATALEFQTISITESQITDLQSYLTAETNDLSTAVTGTLGTGNGGTGLSVIGTANQVLAVNAGATALEFQTLATGGTVTSVAVSGSDGIEVDSGSPITSSGTIALGINATSLSTHLGLGTAATTAATDYATAAQGATADTALQNIEHANSISDSITVVSGNNRLYIGDTTFSGTLTVAGKMVILDGPINLTGTMNLTGTLSVRH